MRARGKKSTSPKPKPAVKAKAKATAKAKSQPSGRATGSSVSNTPRRKNTSVRKVPKKSPPSGAGGSRTVQRAAADEMGNAFDEPPTPAGQLFLSEEDLPVTGPPAEGPKVNDMADTH